MATVSAPDLDRMLLDPAFFADPYPAYRRLQEEAPVFWSAGWGAWVLTRYDDVVATLRDSKHFSNAGRMPLLMGALPAAAEEHMRVLATHFTQGLIHTDPPDHTRLRGLVNKAFTSRAVERIRPQVAALVDDLIAAHVDDGQLEVVRDLAYPLPAIVIATMLGVPPEDRDLFKHWSDDIIMLQETDGLTAQVAAHGRRAVEEMKDYLAGLLAARRSKPTDDLISSLAAAEDEGQALTAQELLATCVTLLIAGHETTTGLITSGVLTLLRHPDQLALLQEHPELLGAAVEEILRYESPIQRDFRRVTADTEIDGVTLPAGALVFQMLGAANRDPGHFPDPDRFDIAREKNRHLAFGYGIHFCVGAPLARLEGPIALAAILRLQPELATDSVTWQRRRSFRCSAAVPIRFAGRAERA